jgi:hypothetical protein
MIPFNAAASIGQPKLLSRQDLVTIIVRLEFDGWRLARSRDPALTSEVSETYMNGRLFQGMRDIRNALKLTNIFLVEVPGVRTDEELATPDREPDVILLFAEFGSNEPHVVIECKRLDPEEASRALRGEYVRSGVDRFISGAYGLGHDLDFMVGYLLNGDGASAVADINAYLTNVGRTDCFLEDTDMFGRYGFVAASNHKRSVDGSSVRLLHSFLDFG